MKKSNLFTTITIIGLVVLTLGIFVFTRTVSAQATPTNSGQALEIRPPVLVLNANPGQTIKAQINLSDISKISLLVTSQVNDFVAAGETGIPKLILDNTQTTPYSIKNWVSFEPSLTLKSKENKNMALTIAVPLNASPGGYYGVFRFTATPAAPTGTGVSLSASLGALILLKVNGQAKENVSLVEFSAKKDGTTGTLFESTPVTFFTRLKNNGNIFESPTGQATITDMFNKKVAVLNFNSEGNNILPQSIRRFEAPLDSTVIGNKWLFGRYTASLRMTYGTKNQVITKSFVFWVVPYRLIGVIIVLLIGLAIALYFMIRRYNSYVVKRSQGTRRRNKR
jgi:hypothetical protein